MRRVLAALVFLISIALGGIITLLVIPFSRKRLPSLVLLTWGKVVLWAAGIRLDIRGKEHIPPKGPTVYMANHASILDIPILAAALPVDLRFLYKRSLSFIPLVGWAMYLMGMVPIDRYRHNKAIRGLKLAARRLNQGYRLLIFPEGTRTRNGELGRFKRGGFRLAASVAADIIAVSLENTQKVCGRNSILAGSGSLRITVHPAVSTADLTEDQVLELPDKFRTLIISELPTKAPSA